MKQNDIATDIGRIVRTGTSVIINAI